jgi:hypothetical protein
VQCLLCWCTYLQHTADSQWREWLPFAVRYTMSGVHFNLLYVWTRGSTSAEIKTAQSYLCPLPTSVMCGSLSPRSLALSLHALKLRLWDKIIYVRFWFLTAMILSFVSFVFCFVDTTLRDLAYQKTTILRSAYVFLSFFVRIFPHFILEWFCQVMYSCYLQFSIRQLFCCCVWHCNYTWVCN